MRLHEQISYNFGELADFLGSPEVPDRDRPKVEVRFDTVERQYPSPFHPECYWHVLNSLLMLRRRGVKVHGWIWVHPCWLHEWVQLLVSQFSTCQIISKTLLVMKRRSNPWFVADEMVTAQALRPRRLLNRKISNRSRGHHSSQMVTD